MAEEMVTRSERYESVRRVESTTRQDELDRLLTRLSLTSPRDADFAEAIAGFARLADASRASFLAPFGRMALRVLASSSLTNVGDLIISLERYPEIQEVLRSGTPVLIEDVCSHPLMTSALPQLVHLKIKAVAAVPVTLGSMRAIMRMTSKDRAFDEHDLDFLVYAARSLEATLSSRVEHDDISTWRRLSLSMADAVIEVAGDGRVLATTGDHSLSTGKHTPPPRGLFLEDLVDEPSARRAHSLVLRLLDGECAEQGEVFRLRPLHGKPVRVRGWSSRLQGFAPGALVALRRMAPADLTGGFKREERLKHSLQQQIDEVRALRLQLDELESIRTQFLSASAHELKTPLTVIQSYLETLVTDLTAGLSQEQLSFLRITYESVLKLRRLVVDLVDLAALDSGKVRLDVGRVALEPVVSAVTRELAPLANRGGVTVTCEGLSALRDARADPVRIQQVVRNLLENSIKFTPAGGSVTIRGSTHNDSVVVAVVDTGIGIPEDRVGVVFDEFFQAGPEARILPKGAGLGLAITRRIVRGLGGRIEVESNEGKGSTFSVYLPQWPEGDDANPVDL